MKALAIALSVLATHTSTGGVGQDVFLGAGDWCSAYGLGGALDQPVTSGARTPFGLDEVGAPGGVCGAVGDTWHLRVFGHPGNPRCAARCGMHRYVSFAGQDVRTWPLEIGATVTLERLDVAGGATGFLCPVLYDTASGRYVEVCLETWKAGFGFPESTSEDGPATRAVCAGAGGRKIDSVWSRFAPGTRFATLLAGRTVAAGTGTRFTRTFRAAITRADVARIAGVVNASCAWPTALSANADDWALAGIEDGLEGAGITIAEQQSRLG